MRGTQLFTAILFVSFAHLGHANNVCGQVLSLAMEQNLQGRFSLLEANLAKEPDTTTCILSGTGPENANYQLEILLAKNRSLLVAQKFYLATSTFYDGKVPDGQKLKDSEGELGGVQKRARSFYKNFNVPHPDQQEKLLFRITFLKTGVVVGEGAIP